MKEKIAVYPGTFNPFHEGHKSVVKKALLLFDKVYIVPSINVNKNQNLNLEKIVNQIKNFVSDLDRVEVIANGELLTVEFASRVGANFMIRGLRSEQDMVYELGIYDGNKMLNQNIETVYFFSDNENRKVSSTVLREIAAFNEKVKEQKKNEN